MGYDGVTNSEAMIKIVLLKHSQKYIIVRRKKVNVRILLDLNLEVQFLYYTFLTYNYTYWFHILLQVLTGWQILNFTTGWKPEI